MSVVCYHLLWRFSSKTTLTTYHLNQTSQWLTGTSPKTQSCTYIVRQASCAAALARSYHNHGRQRPSVEIISNRLAQQTLRQHKAPWESRGELGIVQNPRQFPLYLCPKLWSSQWIQRPVHSLSPVPCGYTLYILISFDLGKHCFVEATPWQVLISSASDRRQDSQGKFFCRLFWHFFFFFFFFFIDEIGKYGQNRTKYWQRNTGQYCTHHCVKHTQKRVRLLDN